MKPIIYVKGSDISDVRLQKFVRYFVGRNEDISFWGWSRDGQKLSVDGVKCRYLLTGGGYGKKSKLFFFYFLWVIVVFFKCLKTNLKEKTVIAIDFDSALPVYLASKFKKIDYIYEVYDDFALRYNFPSIVKRFVHKRDTIIMKRSKCVIHVDSNRVTYKDCQWIIIENTPNDYWRGVARPYDNLKHKFAIIGYFSDARGMEQIYKFAKENNKVLFLLVGRFTSEKMKEEFMALSNVESYDLMPQMELFDLMKDCCGIFSLYNPRLEINRYAASNKVYDAMMMGIPVITNREVINSAYIQENGFGIVVDYEYGDSWSSLSNPSFVKVAKELGIKGRDLYLKEYRFDVLVENRLVPVLE